MSLNSSRRSELRAEAHTLSPVVIIGDKGLTDEVVKEIDRSLKAHELIKVRAASADRKARGAWMKQICEQLGAEPVQEIGKVLVIYRKNPEAKEETRDKREETRDKRKETRDKREETRDKREETRDARSEKRTGKRQSRVLPLASSSLASSSKRTSRPRSRTPSPRPESSPRRRRPTTSR